MFETVPGQVIRAQFSAFEDDGVTKRSGLSVAGGDFSVGVWRNGVVDALPVAIAEIGSSGEYLVQLTPATEGHWVADVTVAFSQDVFRLLAAVFASADTASILDRVDRVLGLLHMNAMVDNQAYDAFGQLTSARLRVFSAPGNVPAAPGGSEGALNGLIHEYAIEAEYAGRNQLTNYNVRRVT